MCSVTISNLSAIISKDKVTWGTETFSGFEFSLSREVCVCNGTAENKISLLSFPQSISVLCQHSLITSIFNRIVFLLAVTGNVSEYEEVGVTCFLKTATCLKDPTLLPVETVA